MAPLSLLSLLAFASLAVLSFSPLQATALSTKHDLLARHSYHHSLSKKKRAGTKLCKNRSVSVKAASTSSSTKTSTSNSSKSTGSSKSDDNKDDNKGSSSSSGSSGSSGGGYSSSKKVGLAWPNGDDNALQYYKTDKTGPLYTWSPWVTPLAKKYGFDPVPMFWGPKDADDFKRLVVEGYAHAVLGFNEPNQDGQSDISPEYGAQLWKQYINPLKDKGYKLISPATTSAPSGKTWMKNFFKACDGCHFDAVALHWYDVSADAFIAYVTDFHDTFGKPIWVTEFACQNFNNGPQCTKDQVFAFMDKVTSWMDRTSWVEHYFAFGVMHDMQNVNYDNQLMASNGKPTSLGYKYINA